MSGAKPGGRTKPKRKEPPAGAKAPPKAEDLRPTASDEDFEHVLRRLIAARGGLKDDLV
jgi:hypothetical protein